MSSLYDTVYNACACVCVCASEAGEIAHSLTMRSASDDQLLSHSETFARDSGTSSLRCDSDDIQNLIKSGDIEIKQRPMCNHDVPENCSSACWTFVKQDDAVQRLMPDDDSDKTDSCSSVTQQRSMTKSKSSELLDDASNQSSLTRSTCFYPASW